jgi:hypothetical protein
LEFDVIRFPRRLTTVLPFLSVAATMQCAQARPLWTIPPLSSFDGHRWGEMQLGVTTFRQIRDRYETGKGSYERSTELTQPKDTPVRVDLLWTKRGEDEVLRAITVRFSGAGPRVEEVSRLYESKDKATETYFMPGRYEDWSVLRFAPRGVAAMALKDGGIESVPLLLLTSPDALSALPRQLTTTFSPVERRFDPHENDPKIMEFDDIKVDVDLSDDLELPYGEKRDTINEIEDATAGGTIRNRSRGDGSYKLKVTGSERGNKGGTIYVTATIEGNGPYGPITATGSGSDSWTWTDKERKEDRYKDHSALQRKVRGSYRDAVREARTAAENSFAQQMERSGPPPLWVVREGQWSRIIDEARNWSGLTEGAESILR